MKANNKRKVFGDAVDLLMDDIEERAVPRGLQMLSVKSIKPFHDHPFHLYEGERLEDMIASIKEHGILNPVIVQKVEDGYEMLSGHNRLNAAKLAGLKEVPAIVKTGLSEEEAYVYVIETNLMQRSFSDLLISEKAAVLKELDIHTINWNQQYSRNNQTYRMLISICYLVLKGLLQTTTDGSTKLMQFVDEQRMCRLYEKFILEYYRKEHSEITANASQIPWQLDDDFSDMLPVMQTDIMLSQGAKVLIIDAKYYEHTTQTQYDKHTLHSNNLYQIFTYVKNGL